jgi:hypothetical protein
MNNNMHILNEMVMAVCPIQNVYFEQDGYIGIVYQEPDISNEQQKQAAQEVISKWPLEEAKLEKLAKIDEEWNQTIAQGWDSGQGILGISAEDVALLSANFSMAKEAANLGYPIPPIITVDSQEISFSDIQSMTIFMLQYGEFRSSISKTFAARRRAVQNASTIEEVVVI